MIKNRINIHKSQSSPWVFDGAKDTSLMDVTWDPLMSTGVLACLPNGCGFFDGITNKTLGFLLAWRIYWQRLEIYQNVGLCNVT